MKISNLNTRKLFSNQKSRPNNIRSAEFIKIKKITSKN